MEFYNSISFFLIALVFMAAWNRLALISFLPLAVKQVILLTLNVFFLYNLTGFRDFQLAIIMAMAVFACGAAALITIVRRRFQRLRICAFILCSSAIVLLLGALCVFKYQPAANLAFSLYPAPFLFDEGDLSRRLIRFIGISYAVFKMMQIVIDANRGMLKRLSLLTALNFVCFFPVFISGPITRYNEFSEDLHSFRERKFLQQWPAGIYRIATGIIKSLLISPFLYEISIAQIPDPVILQMPWYKAMIVMYAYGLYIYMDFSGYCDMAIGFGWMMGFRVPENFRNPFISRNIQEFWSRWHITLSQWLRDYFYYPFLKWQMKTFEIRNIILPASAIFLTFILMGLWHDVTLTNLWYGMYHGAGLAFFMVFSEKTKQTKAGIWMKNSIIWKALAIVITFHFYFLSFLVFCGKAESFLKTVCRGIFYGA